MSMDLRPLSLGELLDRAFTLYRRHFTTFVGIMAVPAAVATVLGVIVQLMQSQIQAQALAAAEGGTPPDPLNTLMVVGVGFVAMMGLMVVYWAAYTVALGAASAAVSEIYLGRTASVSEAYGHVRERIGRLLLLMVLVTLRLMALGGVVALVTLGSALALSRSPLLQGLTVFVLLLAGFLIVSSVMLRYALSVPALVLENISANASIRRSVELVRGSLWRVVVLLLFATVIAYITVMIVQGPLMVAAMMAGPASATAFWLNMAGAVLGGVAGAISGPIMIIAFALLYYDVRIRQEGLDVQLMMAMLPTGPHGAPGATGAAPFPG